MIVAEGRQGCLQATPQALLEATLQGLLQATLTARRLGWPAVLTAMTTTGPAQGAMPVKTVIACGGDASAYKKPIAGRGHHFWPIRYPSCYPEKQKSKKPHEGDLQAPDISVFLAPAVGCASAVICGVEWGEVMDR